MLASVVAIALAASLGGVEALAAPPEREHRCRCPASSEHRCSCVRCAVARPPAADANVPPCHRAKAAARPRPAPPGAPSVGSSCHDPAAAGLAGEDEEPFLLDPGAPTVAPGRAEPLPGHALAATLAPASPEPPPPRS